MEIIFHLSSIRIVLTIFGVVLASDLISANTTYIPDTYDCYAGNKGIEHFHLNITCIERGMIRYQFIQESHRKIKWQQKQVMTLLNVQLITDGVSEGFKIEYTGDDELQDAIEEVLGDYEYIGMIKTNDAAVYGQVDGYTGNQGIIYKDWDDDGIWKGVVRYFVDFIIKLNYIFRRIVSKDINPFVISL